MSAALPLSLSRVGRVAVAVSMSLVLVACGADGPDAAGDIVADVTVPGGTEPEPVDAGSGAVEPNGEVVDVVALDNTFRAETIEITAGTEVRWENRGRNEHDVVPADESSVWGVDVAGFAPGDEYATVFTSPGEYPYFCSLHGTADAGMVGSIVVLPADS